MTDKESRKTSNALHEWLDRHEPSHGMIYVLGDETITELRNIADEIGDVPRTEPFPREAAQVSCDIGWLEGFGQALWARADIDGALPLSPETCATFGNVVDRLRENVIGISMPDGRDG